MKSATISFFIVLLLITPVVFVNAQSVDITKDVLSSVGNKIFGEGESDIVVIIGRVIQAILGLVGVVFTILIIYGGILYMTAIGNQEQVGRARTLIRDSIIGLVIIITAFAITDFVVFNLIVSVEG